MKHKLWLQYTCVTGGAEGKDEVLDCRIARCQPKRRGFRTRKAAPASLHPVTIDRTLGPPPQPSHLPLLWCLVEHFGFWGVLLIPGSAL